MGLGVSGSRGGLGGVSGGGAHVDEVVGLGNTIHHLAGRHLERLEEVHSHLDVLRLEVLVHVRHLPPGGNFQGGR